MALTAFLVLANIVLLGMYLRGRAVARRAARTEAEETAALARRSGPVYPVVRILPPPHRPVARVATVPAEVADLAAYRLRRAIAEPERVAR